MLPLSVVLLPVVLLRELPPVLTERVSEREEPEALALRPLTVPEPVAVPTVRLLPWERPRVVPEGGTLVVRPSLVTVPRPLLGLVRG